MTSSVECQCGREVVSSRMSRIIIAEMLRDAGWEISDDLEYIRCSACLDEERGMI